MPLLERRCLIADSEAGRVDLVVRRLTKRSRAEVRGMFDHDCVRINGAVCAEPGALVAAGDELSVRFDPHTRYREKPKPPQDPAFRVVHEDEHLIVVEKEASILTVPVEGSRARTLVDAVSEHLSRGRRKARALVVHRLDRGTSGLLVFAKNHEMAGRLQNELRAHKLERTYIAVVAGTVKQDAGTFDTFLGTNASLSRFSTDDETGERAVTHYVVENRVGGATLVRVTLETGRRHQIRVHFSEAGHPVLGDRRYRPELARHPWWTANRLALHASVLAFRHPATGAMLRFESPPPAEFRRFLPHPPRGPRR